MKNKIYKVFSITLSISLSGCMGIYEGGFECPAGTGVGCKSISDVNEMVNLGEIPKASSLQPSEEAKPARLEIWYAPTFRNQASGFRSQNNSLTDSDQIPFPKKEQRKRADLTDA